VPQPYEIGGPNAGPGWFSNLELGVVKPHIKCRVTSGTPLNDAFPGPVLLPIAPMDWTAAARLEFGYRLPEGHGDIRLSYRLIASEGTRTFPALDGIGAESLKSRLNLHAVDLDYVSTEWLVNQTPDLFRDLRWAFGARLLVSYFDSQLGGDGDPGERMSSHFVGAGPHVQGEWSHALGDSPLSLYASLEASGVVGSNWQNFAEALTVDGALLGAARRGGAQSDGIGIVDTQVGFCWAPSHNDCLRVIAGYQFERFWNLGRTDDSNAELTIQGMFVRGELRY
jgi:hypothetical protein